MQAESPLRLLVKSYESGLVNRIQYIEVRRQLLKKLSTQGIITHEDLKNYMSIQQDTEQLSTVSGYSLLDWVTIILGLLAATTLAFFLYK